MTERLWHRSYPPEIAREVELEDRSLQARFDEAVATWPDLTLCDFLDRRYSFREIAALADRAARGFQSLGVDKGTRVGLFLPNTPHYIIAFLGALKAGATIVNFSPLYAPRELKHQIDDSGVEVMVTLDLAVLYPNLAKALPGTGVSKLVVGNLPEVLPFPKGLLYRLARRKERVPIPTDERHVAFAALLDNDGDYQAVSFDGAEHEIALLQYTGGTTGVPKGAMLSHRNLAASIAIGTTWSEPVLEAGIERVILVLPLFHIYALSSVFLASIFRGAELILHPRFDPKKVLEDIHRKRPTLFAGVPTMYTALLQHPDLKKCDFSSLKALFSGGAPLPVEVLRRLEQVTGCPVLEGYGLTETAPACIANPWSGTRKPGSIGLPLPGTTVEIRDVDDPEKLLGVGETGEICIIGPQVTRGYWGKPEETQQAIRGERLHTGDVGYMDEEGYVFLVDRKKDMIISSGYNVYPRNIEEAIWEHPAVAEVTVIGIPDAYRGEAAKAFIRLNPGASLTFEELTRFLADKLGRHEMPAAMEIRDELPKTPVGKLSKKELIAEELARHEARAAEASIGSG